MKFCTNKHPFVIKCHYHFETMTSDVHARDSVMTPLYVTRRTCTPGLTLLLYLGGLGKFVGIIPDVVRLLEKYNLSCVLDAYERDSAFPSTFTWKRMVKYEIHGRELYQWHTRTSQPEFAHFHRIVPTFDVHNFWTLSKTCPKITDACKSVIQVIGSIWIVMFRYAINAIVFYNNAVDHCIYF